MTTSTSRTWLRGRPAVFISSTIDELEQLRADVDQDLAALDLVDEWVWELHAIASGEIPKTQYLKHAASCDVFILIIAKSDSEATWAEYAAAYSDNPGKILPFFLGSPTSATQRLRDLIDARHTRVQVDDTSELRTRLVATLKESVLSGRFAAAEARRLLTLEIERRTTRTARNTLSVLPWAGGGPLATTFPKEAEGKLKLLEGPGGAGKTVAGMVLCYRWTREPGILPVFVVARPSRLNLEELILSSFDAMRFSPGHQLLERYGREGQLKVVVDGIDTLRPDDRDTVWTNAIELAARWPRSTVLALTRTHSPRFHGDDAYVITLDPMSDQTIEWIFSAHGIVPFDLESDLALPLQALVRLPLWAAAIASTDGRTSHPIGVIDGLMSMQLKETGGEDTLETGKLLSALGALALAASGSDRVEVNIAMSALVKWQREPHVSGRWESEPAESLLRKLIRSDLLRLEGGDLVFAHPLFATASGSSEALSSPATFAAGNDDLTRWTAARLAAEAHAKSSTALLAMLACQHLTGLVEVLRLVPPHRQPSSSVDTEKVRRFFIAWRTLLQIAGPLLQGRSKRVLHVLMDNSWLAWAWVEGIDGDLVVEWASTENGVTLDDWATRVGNRFVIRPEPFAAFPPELVAAEELITAFKEGIAALQEAPGEAAEGAKSASHPVTLSDVREAVARREQELANLLRVSGLVEIITGANTRLHIEVSNDGNDLMLRVRWATESLILERDATEAWGFVSAAEWVARDSHHDAFDQFRHLVEDLMGSPLDSPAWYRPQAWPAWDL